VLNPVAMIAPAEPKHPVLAALADALHEHLARSGTTPQHLGGVLQITPQYAHKLCRGDSYPSPSLQCRMRRQLGLDFNALLDSVDPRDLADWRSAA
jgi:hypothetical protein